MRVRDRLGSLRRRRQARARIEHAGLDQRSGRARVQAQRAAAAPWWNEILGRLELEIGHERAERDERAVARHDRHRVPAGERQPGADRRLAIDVVVRVDEDGRTGAVLGAEPCSERLEARAERRVRIVPGIPRHPADEALRALARRAPQGQRRCDHRARAPHEPLGVARARRVGQREAQVAEQAAGPSLGDRRLALGVRLRAGDADAQAFQLLQRCEIHAGQDRPGVSGASGSLN